MGKNASKISFQLVMVLTFLFAFLVSSMSFAETGEEIFQSKGCIACHTIGKGKLAGPDLLGVTERREEEWLRNWLKNPETMLLSDPIAQELLKEYFVPMPNQDLSDEQVEILIEYFKEMDKQNKDKD